MKKFKGIVFDFNGTLLWDTPLHNNAWDEFLERHSIRLNAEEKIEKIHGKNNRDILTNLFDRPLSKDDIGQFIIEKETIYQNLCYETGIELAPGAITFFNFLKNREIKYTIATASGIENIDFYFQHFKLGKWFDRNLVVYDDGTNKGKPDPDFFLKAIEKLGLESSEIVIFEDSLHGIKAAENSKPGMIYIVDSNNYSFTQWDYPKIRSFDEVDRELF